MKYILLAIALICVFISLVSRVYLYQSSPQASNVWFDHFEKADDNNDSVLEAKQNYNQRHKRMDDKHKELTHTSKINEKTHGEIGQFENPYQEAVYQFSSAIYNRIDSIHHRFEIIRHKKDPFLQTDAKYFIDVNPEEALSSVDHYQRKYESYLKQTIQFITDTPAITITQECNTPQYFVKPKHNAACLSSCDCTGNMLCNENQCVGNSNQNEAYVEAQQAYATSMYETYFLNFIQHYHMEKKLDHYLNEKYKLGVKFDQKSIIETAETLFDVFYNFQQLVQSTKGFTKNENTNLSFDKSTFEWIAQQTKYILEQQLTEEQQIRLDLDLTEISAITKDVAKKIQDPSNVQEWITLMQQETDITDFNYKFPEIQSQVAQFSDLEVFTSDNIGSFITFKDLFEQIKNNNFDAGNMNSDAEVQTLAIGSDIAGVVFATLYTIFC